MRIVFMGTPAFAVPTLEALLRSSHEVVAVYTAPPRPAHRGKKVTLSPIHALAEAQGVPVHTPASLKDTDTQHLFANHQADAAVVVAYGLLLPPAILEAYRYGCINIHPSRLPRWRGAAPIQRTLMAGDRETTICIMQMDAGLDTGAVLMEESHLIEEHTTAQELEHHLAMRSAPLLIQTLQGITNETIMPMPQLSDGVTYAAKIRKEEALLDFLRPAHAVMCHIHGLSPFPGAYFLYRGERIKILRAEAVNTQNILPAGTVVDNQLTIQCGTHGILPLLLQREGKTPMHSTEFLRGFPIAIGEFLV
jgi:methionyl-tRNA formyltransferase